MKKKAVTHCPSQQFWIQHQYALSCLPCTHKAGSYIQHENINHTEDVEKSNGLNMILTLLQYSLCKVKAIQENKQPVKLH